MLIYNETCAAFLKRIKVLAREILKKEMGMSYRQSRILYNGMLYPIQFVTFTGKELGYFNPHHYHIGLNRNLIYSVKEHILKDILRHELAHYFCHILHGHGVQDHGVEYRRICAKFNWGKNVCSAKLDLNLANNYDGDLTHERLVNRVKKLLSLASSDNPHESQMATKKANEILLQHNLKLLDQDQNQSPDYFIKKVLQFKRATAKQHAIYEILQKFFVCPVFNYGKGMVWLEVTGTKENVEVADYIANYLDNELERLYQFTKLKGIKQKNSFMRGVAKGYIEKVQEINIDQKALVKINNNLQIHTRKIYGRLSGKSSEFSTDTTAENIGRRTGRSMQINKGISANNTKTFLLS